MKIRIDNCIVAFPVLFTAKSFRDSDPAFSASFLFDDNTKVVNMETGETGDIALLKQSIIKVAKDKWPQEFTNIIKTLAAQDKLPYHDGDLKSKYEGFAGRVYLSARSKARPITLDRDGSALSETEGKIYSGARVNARVDLWAQDNQYGKRVNASLKGVQFEADDKPLAGDAPASPDEFELSGEPASGGGFDDLGL